MKYSLSSWSPCLLSVLRAVSGLLMMQHGGQKVLGFPAPSKMPFELMSQIGVAGILELVGGFLLAIGLFTRPTAFILSGLMAVAYFIAHAPKGFWPMVNGGELAVLYCFVFLYLAAASRRRQVQRRRASRWTEEQVRESVFTPNGKSDFHSGAAFR